MSGSLWKKLAGVIGGNLQLDIGGPRLKNSSGLVLVRNAADSGPANIQGGLVPVFVDKGNSGTSTQTLDFNAGQYQKLTVTGAHTIALSNWPASGTPGEMVLQLVNGGAYAVTWPTINWVKSDGTTTTTFSSNGVTLQTSGTDWVFLWSTAGSGTLYGKIMR